MIVEWSMLIIVSISRKNKTQNITYHIILNKKKNVRKKINFRKIQRFEFKKKKKQKRLKKSQRFYRGIFLITNYLSSADISFLIKKKIKKESVQVKLTEAIDDWLFYFLFNFFYSIFPLSQYSFYLSVFFSLILVSHSNVYYFQGAFQSYYSSFTRKYFTGFHFIFIFPQFALYLFCFYL